MFRFICTQIHILLIFVAKQLNEELNEKREEMKKQEDENLTKYQQLEEQLQSVRFFIHFL